MPVSELQARVLREIAANRTPDSYLAGATVLHRAEDSPRFSRDLDIFHDLAEAVAVSAEADARTLQRAGYSLTWALQTPTFYRAVAEVTGQSLKLEWAHDSAFRFFPVERDEFCGFRLHPADAAVNKMLAMAGRVEVRDFVDVLHLDAEYLSLGALAWAGCGKDPGYTPDFLLDHAAAHTAYRPADLARLHLRDGRASHLPDIAPTLERVVAVGGGYPETRRLARWIAEDVLPEVEAKTCAR